MGSTIVYPGRHDPSFYEDVKTPYPGNAASSIPFMDALDQSTVLIRIGPTYNWYLKSDNGYFSMTSNVNEAGKFLVNVYNSSEIGFTYVPTGNEVYLNTKDDESLTQGIYVGGDAERRFYLSNAMNSPERLNLFSTAWPFRNNVDSPPVYLTPVGTGRSLGATQTSSYRGWNIPDSSRKSVVFTIVDDHSPIVQAFKNYSSNAESLKKICCDSGMNPARIGDPAVLRVCYGKGYGLSGACDAAPPGLQPNSDSSPPPNSNPNDNPAINAANPNVAAVVTDTATARLPITNTTPVVKTASTTPTWVYIVILFVIFAVLIAIIVVARAAKKNSASEVAAAPGAAAPPLAAN